MPRVSDKHSAELWGFGEAARALGTSPDNLRRLSQTDPRFPDYLGKVGRARVYLAADLRAYWTARVQRRRRERKF